MSWSRSRRQAAILMLVLVVLAVAGLLGLQAVQSLVLIRSAESQRQQMMQSKEVLEFARQAAAVGGRFETTEVAVEEQTAELSVDGESEEGAGLMCVVVRYPLGEPSELKTSWPVQLRNRGSEVEPALELDSESKAESEPEANRRSEVSKDTDQVDQEKN
ncbi:MAG: hypothetical protein VXZ82_14960 [Planctomycetota bacterium]|nr:hypothetical protein [Planctomycetota bacterium]